MIIVELLNKDGRVLSTTSLDETIVKKYEHVLEKDGPLEVSGLRIKFE